MEERLWSHPRRHSSHAHYKTSRGQIKRKSPADRETIRNQRASETHLTRLSVYQQTEGWETSEGETSRYLRTSKWDRHSSQHTRASRRAVISIRVISEESGGTLTILFYRQAETVCMWLCNASVCVCVCESAWRQERKSKNEKRKIIQERGDA